MLQKTIEQDLFAAMKRKDEFSTKVLRFLKSHVDAAAKDKRAELTEEEVIKVLQKRVKQSQDAEAQYLLGGRAELAGAERKEIEIISRYLPAQLGAEQLDEIVAGVIKKIGAVGKADFGRVMGMAMTTVAGRADGKAVKTAVERLLAPQ